MVPIPILNAVNTPTVETPETDNEVTDAIPPITLVAIPALVEKVALEALPAKLDAVIIPVEFTLPTLKLPNVPTEVSEEVVILLPKVLLESTEVPLIL